MLTSPDAVAPRDWLLLWRLLQQSSQAFHHLQAVFPDVPAMLAASPAQWRAAGVSPASAARLAAWQAREPGPCDELERALAADQAWCEGPQATLLTLHDPDYPPLLREIADAPPLLFLCGDASLLGLPQLAIVGSRQPSHGGRSDAAVLAGELARAGLVITSGMARGVDGAAHAGALAAGGRTLAVLGSGADTPYPREHRRLHADIAAGGGLVVSEFLPGTAPLAPNFPRRNRVISGLALGVLVVEAAPESGSLITARLAAEQGRLVWALPGSRHHPQARGCLQLIRDGATLVTDSAQILADLPPMLGLLREQLAPSPAPAAHAPTLGREARLLLRTLGQECRHADWLIASTGLAPALVLRTLSELELAGLVVAVPGGYERCAAGAALA